MKRRNFILSSSTLLLGFFTGGLGLAQRPKKAGGVGPRVKLLVTLKKPEHLSFYEIEQGALSRIELSKLINKSFLDSGALLSQDTTYEENTVQYQMVFRDHDALMRWSLAVKDIRPNFTQELQARGVEIVKQVIPLA